MERVTLSIITVLFACGLWVPAVAQDPLTLPENHYLVWQLGSGTHGHGFAAPVRFADQFGMIESDFFTMDKWGNPIFEKNGVQVLWDALVHNSWWRLEHPASQPRREVKVEHQFGIYDIETFDAVYVLLPSDKNDQIPDGWPDWANHYICYDAVGAAPDPGANLIVTDQWGTWPSGLLELAYFCNPAEKTETDGTVYDIVDPSVHLTCYLVDGVPGTFEFNFGSQWGTFFSLDTESTCLVCLPSFKLSVVPTEERSWGKIKSMYWE